MMPFSAGAAGQLDATDEVQDIDYRVAFVDDTALYLVDVANTKPAEHLDGVVGITTVFYATPRPHRSGGRVDYNIMAQVYDCTQPGAQGLVALMSFGRGGADGGVVIGQEQQESLVMRVNQEGSLGMRIWTLVCQDEQQAPTFGNPPMNHNTEILDAYRAQVARHQADKAKDTP